MPLNNIEPQLPGQKPPGIKYYSGYDRGPKWSDDESSAIPLFFSSRVGEFSVRWNQYILQWILLYNSGNPRGIVMHTAAQPWGPWSSAKVIFSPVISDPSNPSHQGYGTFIHDPGGQDQICDILRPDDYGGEYGPYQIAPYSTGVEDGTKIYFIMSTWNPYQTVLMSAVIPFE
jgi:hypothetical protein